MGYLLGFIGLVGWIVSLPWRWPPGSIELLMLWLCVGVWFLLTDRHWPAMDR